MPEIKAHTPGTFCWFELGTTDQEAAKAFYTSLFGFTFEDMPIGEGATYTMLRMGGKEVAALYKMGPERQGMPPSWGTYVAVESADEAAKKAAELGAKILAPAFDVFDQGRMAAFLDPTGAAISVWQAKKHIGAQLIGEPGSVCWNELLTSNVDVARSFYTRLFGWGAKMDPVGGMPYTQFQQGSESIGGMMQIPGEWGNVPSHWSLCFAVNDTDATVEKAKSLGATIKGAPMDIPTIGRYAMIQDPQGAVFSVLQFAARS